MTTDKNAGAPLPWRVVGPAKWGLYAIMCTGPHPHAVATGLAPDDADRIIRAVNGEPVARKRERVLREVLSTVTAALDEAIHGGDGLIARGAPAWLIEQLEDAARAALAETGEE